MELLIYYNIKNDSFSYQYVNIGFKEIGSYYKTNQLIIADIIINEKKNPLKFVKRKLSHFKYDLGDFFINLGKFIQGGKKVLKKDVFKPQWWYKY